MQAIGLENQPINKIHWIHFAKLKANSYNPNKVFTTEFDLLKTSILENGWTQPVVVNESEMEIVDGFHRWSLVSNDKQIQELTDCKVPVVFAHIKNKDDQMMATVRHNRARGKHGILKMSDIIRSLHQNGQSKEQICKQMGIDEEEFFRMVEFDSSPKESGMDSFGKAWVPTKDKGSKKDN